MRWTSNKVNGGDQHLGNNAFALHDVGWVPLIVPPLISPGNGSAGYADATDTTGKWYTLNPQYASSHADLGYGNAPGLVTYAGGSLDDVANVSMLQYVNQPVTQTKNETPYWAGTTQSQVFNTPESYPGRRQSYLAPASEQVWKTDWPGLNPLFGGVPSQASGLYSQTITKIRGTTYDSGSTTNLVYMVPFAGGLSLFDMKRVVYAMVAGRTVFKDMSGPGSVITDSNVGYFCIAYAAGECRPNSQPGNAFVSMTGYYSSSNYCLSNNITMQVPCLLPLAPLSNGAVEFRIVPLDQNATGHRKLTTLFTAPTQPYSFQTWYSDPQAKWGFAVTPNTNGQVQEVFRFKIPSWTAPVADSVSRSSFVNVPFKFSGLAGDKRRIAFGYTENGAASNLYCTTRQETCWTSATATPTNPFAFNSETQSKTACDNGCTINVPAIPGRVLWVQVELTNGSNVTTYPLQAISNP
jgi:hypothetical protein